MAMTDFDTILETFSLMDDWEDRYAYLIDMGRTLPDFPDQYRDDEHLVPGCTSRVWIQLDWDNEGRLQIQADSDAHIVRGLVAVLCSLLSGKTREELTQINVEEAFSQLGLDQYLSPSRRNGFFSMVSLVQKFCQQR